MEDPTQATAKVDVTTNLLLVRIAEALENHVVVKNGRFYQVNTKSGRIFNWYGSKWVEV